LTAYVDGELDGASRRRIEDWLTGHPDAAAEVESQRRLTRLWRATAAAEPTPAQWDVVLNRVAASLPIPRSPRPAWRRPLFIVAVLGASAAAAVLLALTLPRPQQQSQVVSVVPTEEVEPFAVVLPEDVEIVRMRPADSVALVVGVPPVEGPLDLAEPGDVELENVEPDADGMVPMARMSDAGDAPMIVAPMAPSPARLP
jgi:hypothetical protein